MKCSEITVDTIVEYMHIDDAEETKAELGMYLEIAKDFIANYTGLPKEGDNGIDSKEDLPIVVFLLVENMYLTKEIVTKSGQMNPVFEMILGLHSTNLL